MKECDLLVFGTQNEMFVVVVKLVGIIAIIVIRDCALYEGLPVCRMNIMLPLSCP